jgi:hypothetical protein
MPIISVLRSLKQNVVEFKASLDCIARTCQKNVLLLVALTVTSLPSPFLSSDSYLRWLFLSLTKRKHPATTPDFPYIAVNSCPKPFKGYVI